VGDIHLTSNEITAMFALRILLFVTAALGIPEVCFAIEMSEIARVIENCKGNARCT
jgi:hypothetical protein